jgi:hypothetical protein
MKLFGWVGVGIAVLLVSGCATARSTGLEPRVTALENKVQTLEADMRATTPSPMESLDTSSGSGRGSGSMSAAEMTKEDIQTALKNAGYYNGAVDGKRRSSRIWGSRRTASRASRPRKNFTNIFNNPAGDRGEHEKFCVRSRRCVCSLWVRSESEGQRDRSRKSINLDRRRGGYGARGS